MASEHDYLCLGDSMRSRTLASILSILIGAICFSAPATAQPGSDGLEPSLAVLEVYINGQDYAKTGEYSARIADELTKIARFSLGAADAARRSIGR